MIQKFVESTAAALEGVEDGAHVLVGGFGGAGRPDHLLAALILRGTTDLTIYANNAGGRDDAFAELIAKRRVRKIVCSYPRALEPGSVIEEEVRAGRVEIELVPQGTLAERIRAGGAGIGAFYTATSAGTPLGEGKETREINGRLHVLEHAIVADVALGHADRADRWGNLVYRRAARNFNPIMLAAARLSVVQVYEEVPLGSIEPENVHTPGIFVDRLVVVDRMRRP